jgi:hypothetical protein
VGRVEEPGRAPLGIGPLARWDKPVLICGWFRHDATAILRLVCRVDRWDNEPIVPPIPDAPLTGGRAAV